MKVLSGVWLLFCLFICLLSSPRVESQSTGTSPAAGEAKFDGPAELPRVYVKSALADTPAPGKILQVKADGNLQSTLESATCGDTITLEAGAVFTGHFLLPKKPCDDAHWIIIRTIASSALKLRASRRARASSLSQDPKVR